MKPRAIPLLICVLVFCGRTAAAADRALGDCVQNSDPDRTISGCSQLLARRGLPIRTQAMILGNRGLAHKRKGQLVFDRGTPTYPGFARANHAEPGYVQAYVHRATALANGGNTAAAVTDIGAALRIEPGSRGRTDLRNLLLAAQSSPRQTAPSAPSENSTDVDDKTLRRRVVDLFRAGKNTEGLQLVETYADRMLREFGSRSERYADALNMKGKLLDALARYKDAAAAYQADISIVERLWRQDDADLLGMRMDLAQDDIYLGQYDAAKAIVAEVLGQDKLGDRGPNEARARYLSAVVAMQHADYVEEEAQVRAALAIWQKQNPNSSDVAGALDLLASCNAHMNRRLEAEADYRLALTISSKVSGPESDAVAGTLDNLAEVVQGQGRFDEAERLYKQSLAIEEENHGAEDPRLANTLGNLATLYSEARRDKEAEAALNRSLVIREKAFGPDSYDVGLTLHNIGAALLRRDRPAEAEKLLTRSLDIFEKTKGPDHPSYAMALNTLASAVRAQQRSGEAEKLLRRSLAIQRKASVSDLTSAAAMLNNLGSIAKDAGRLQEAQALLSEALNDFEHSTASDPLNLVATLESLASLAKGKGDFTLAGSYLARADAVMANAYGPTHPQAIDIKLFEADVAKAQKDWTRALALQRQASTLALQASRRDAGLTKSNDAANRIARAGNGLTSMAWQVAANDPSAGKAALADESFVASQRAHQSAAGAALAQMASRFGAGGTAVAPLVREQQDLSARADALDQKMNRMLSGPDEGRSEAALTQVRAETAEVAARIGALTTRIARDFPAYADLSNPSPSTIAQVQKYLDSDEALVTWQFLDDESFVWAITKEGKTWARLDLNWKTLNTDVGQLRATLDLGAVSRGLARPGPAKDVLFNLEQAHALYTQMFGPVESLIASKKSLIVVPTGALTSLPLHLLVTDVPSREATSMTDTAYRDAAWLVRRQAVTVLPNVGALRTLRAETQPSHATKPLVGFADPVFGRGTGGDNRGLARVEDAPIKAYASYYDDGVVDVDALRRGLPSLPDTADELREVAHQLAAPAADLHFGADATVPEVEHLPLNTYRVVYFATHGLVAGDVKGLSEPALALTIPAKASATDNGLLTASDVAQLKLDADWVVLSACNTAVGETPGAEGLSGLARAFFYAGARALLVSHWPVQSAAAVELSTKTFAAMRADGAIGRAEALREAMVGLIDGRPGDAYPAVWAPFVVVGEGRR